MDYEVTVKIPTAGDTSVLIVGLGEVKNNSTFKVDSEQAANFKTHTGVTLGRAKFQDGITVKALTGKAKEESTAKPLDTEPAEQPVVDGQAVVQNTDGETAKDGK